MQEISPLVFPLYSIQSLRNSLDEIQDKLKWVLDLKEATFVACSDNLSEIKQVVQKVGLNPTFLDKTIKLPFRPPWSLCAEILTQTAFPSDCNGSEATQKNSAFEKSFPWWTA